MQNTILAQATEDDSVGVSLWKDAYHRLLKNKLATIGGIFILIEVVVCLVTPWIAPYGFDTQNLEMTLVKPSMAHWLGTDNLGRDLFTRLLYGGRISMMVGFLASMVSVIVGVVYGAISGFVGGKLDNFMMRVVDVLFALPFVFLVIILMVYFGRNILLLFVALGFTQWLTMARIVRGQVISLKEKEFVEAARFFGHLQLGNYLPPSYSQYLGSCDRLSNANGPFGYFGRSFLKFLRLRSPGPHGLLGNAYL